MFLFKTDDNNIDRTQHGETCRQFRCFRTDYKVPAHFLGTNNSLPRFASLDGYTTQQVTLRVGTTVGMIRAKNHDYDRHYK